MNRLLPSEVPDILCLREFGPKVRATLLGNRKIRDALLANDVQPNLEDKCFTTMTLLSKQRFANSLDTMEKVEGSEDE